MLLDSFKQGLGHDQESLNTNFYICYKDKYKLLSKTALSLTLFIQGLAYGRDGISCQDWSCPSSSSSKMLPISLCLAKEYPSIV